MNPPEAMEELRRQFQEKLNRQFLWGYRVAALLLGIFFVLLAGHRFLTLREPALPRFLAWEPVFLAGFYLCIVLLAPRVRTTGSHVEDLGVLVVLGAIFNSVMVMVGLPSAVQTTDFVLVQVGSAMALRSRLRFVLVQILNLLGWVALFLRVEDAAAPDHWVFATASALLVALALHIFLHGSLRRMEDLYVDRGLAVRQKEQLVAELQESLANVKTLRGLIPICAHCKKVRDDEGYWQAVEQYVMARSEAEFSHGICPQCAEKALQEWSEAKKRRLEGK